MCRLKKIKNLFLCFVTLFAKRCYRFVNALAARMLYALLHVEKWLEAMKTESSKKAGHALTKLR
jgi:hypothetical protein